MCHRVPPSTGVHAPVLPEYGRRMRERQQLGTLLQGFLQFRLAFAKSRHVHDFTGSCEFIVIIISDNPPTGDLT